MSDRSHGDEARRALGDPVAVHANMLSGVIAKPSIENIIHLYGRDALLAALRADPVRAAEEMRVACLRQVEEICPLADDLIEAIRALDQVKGDSHEPG